MYPTSAGCLKILKWPCRSFFLIHLCSKLHGVWGRRMAEPQGLGDGLSLIGISARAQPLSSPDTNSICMGWEESGREEAGKVGGRKLGMWEGGSWEGGREEAGKVGGRKLGRWEGGNWEGGREEWEGGREELGREGGAGKVGGRKLGMWEGGSWEGGREEAGKVGGRKLGRWEGGKEWLAVCYSWRTKAIIHNLWQLHNISLSLKVGFPCLFSSLQLDDGVDGTEGNQEAEQNPEGLKEEIRRSEVWNELQCRCFSVQN